MASYARENLSREANANMDKVFQTGSFKLVYTGTYTEGERKGQSCVVKMFNTGCVYEDSYFDSELKVVSRARDLITRFNEARIIASPIYINQPRVWFFNSGVRQGQKVLVEPMIDNFEKFNSNTGWTPREKTPWIDVMQALSHFSYHSTNRRELLCDLQGGVYKKGYVLTDPVIMSTTLSYPPTDLGNEGMATFFRRHRCNQFCDQDWLVPKDRKSYYPCRKGSSMELRDVPTRHDRDSLSHAMAALSIPE